jgi:hypothetical protein
MEMVTKERLHELIDALREDDLERVGQLLTAVLEDDPVGLSLALAPLDDEPETEDERVAVAEAEADLAAGRIVPATEVFRRLGL